MDNLDELVGVQTQPVSLEDLVEVKEIPPQLPDAAIRNRAATTALLASDKDKVVPDYRNMVDEAKNNQSEYYDRLNEKIQNQARQASIKPTMKILADPYLTPAGKKKIIDGLQNDPFNTDKGVALQTKALESPSKGENEKHEMARISTSDIMREMYAERGARQGLVNAAGANLENVSGARTAVEAGESFLMPFANNMATARMAMHVRKALGKETSLWQTAKDFLLPGNTEQELSREIESVPVSERPAVTRAILDGIKNSRGAILPYDNQYVKMEQMEKLLSEGGYSDSQKWMTNASTLLDIFGMGALARGYLKGGRVAAKEAAAIGKEANAAARVEPTLKGAPITRSELPVDVGYGARVSTGTPEAANNVSELQKLTTRREELINQNASTAAKGDVSSMRSELDTLNASKPVADKESIDQLARSMQKADKQLTYKEAYREAEKRIVDQVADHEAKTSRLASQIDANGVGAETAKELSAIDKRIAELNKMDLNSPGKLNPIADELRRIEFNTTIARDNPASPAKIIQQSNPEQARSLHQAIVKSADDELAQAIYGTTRDQAIISDVMPQVGTQNGRVVSRVPDIGRGMRDELRDAIYNTGRTDLTMEEKETLRNWTEAEFRSTGDFHMNPAMSTFTNEGGRIKISAMYGTSEGGFLNAGEAVQKAKYYLQRFGIQDDEITIMAKQGLDHVPVKLEDVAGKEGNYLVKVDTFHDFDPTDLAKFEHFDVKRNFFDRNPWFMSKKWGSVSKLLMDGSSMLNKGWTSAASVAVDRAAGFNKLLLEEANKFATNFKKLPKDAQARVDGYLREANTKGIAFDRADLVARGMQHEEINTVKAWRDYWDGMHYLENYDLVSTLKSQKYQIMDVNGNFLVAKQMQKDRNITRVYDAMQGKVSFITSDAMDNLYDSGGYIAKLRRPVNIGGEEMEHMIVRNTPNEYLRGLRDTDSILAYRDGYYQISYKRNARFIDEVLPDGTKRTRAVAGDTSEAQMMVDDLKAQRGGVYEIRGDTRALKQSDDTYWDLQSAQGRIAQRGRGAALEELETFRQLGDARQYIADPVEAAIKAADSISGRVVSRPMFESMKARWMSQYGHMVQEVNGMKQYPSNIADIVKKGMNSSKEVADARTVWEHINYLENGYINTIDQSYKYLMNTMGNIMGNLTYKGIDASWLEKGFYRLSEGSPISLAKNAAFQSYIALNPLRQMVVQSHQIVRSVIYNPKGWASGEVMGNINAFLMDKMGVLKNATAEQKAFIKFIEDSGALSAVDRHNLVRGALNDMADKSRVWEAISKPITMSRKIGFDAGEQANLLGHYAAVYDKYKRAGKDLTNLHIRDEAFSEARAISYDMNFAGDMSYNQTALNLVLQFMQVPHKAVLQAVNRRIPIEARRAMVAGDLVMWGTPIGLIGSALGTDLLPNNPKMREVFEDGVESFLVNAAVAGMTGQEHGNLDLSSLAPYDISGWKQFFVGMHEGGTSKVLNASPSGNLLLKPDGRFQVAAKSLGRFFGIIDEVDPKGTDFTAVLNDIAKISSGWTNWQKARIMLNTQQSIDKAGGLTDEHISSYNVFAQALGFGTKNTKDMYEVSKSINDKTKKYEEDVIRSYKDVMQYYATNLQGGNTSPEFMTKVTGWALKMYENDPRGMQIVLKQLEKDIMRPDDKMMGLMLRAAKIPNPGDLKSDIMKMPVPDADKQQMLKIHEDLQNMRKQMQVNSIMKENNHR